jgi:uncharacterized protein (TIGR02145 family)
LFIIGDSSLYGLMDWRNPQNDNLWQGVSGGTNNPCPTGFRLPTQTEWSNLVTAEGITNYNIAYSSSLKLTATGDRNSVDGSLINQTLFGYYWSSSILYTGAYGLALYSSKVNPATYNISRASGLSVRCIKN